MSTLEHCDTRHSTASGAGKRQLTGLGPAIAAIADAVEAWFRARRERHALLQLDDRQLKDIGLSRGDVYREVHQKFHDVTENATRTWPE